MCFAYWCVGAPLAGDGSAFRKNEYGQQLCEDCGKRLNRCKGKLYKKLPGLICQECYNTERSPVSSALAAPPPAPVASRSHKRKFPFEGRSTTTISMTMPPTFNFYSLQQQGWKLLNSSRTTRALCTSWLQLARDNELKQWEIKRGGFYQHDTAPSLKCSFLDEKRVRLHQSADHIARTQLALVGVNVASLNLAAVKLLRSSYGEGLQEIHYDITTYDQAIKCFTVLIYLTDTLSTAIPTLPMSEMRHCFTDGEKRPSPEALKFLSREKFQSKRVIAGDMLVLNCAVPHYGVANPDEQDRYVLFLLYYPSNSDMPDTEQQRYPHGVRS